MTQEIMWSLLIAMGAIAIAAVLDSVRHRRELHLSDKELARAREEIDALKQKHQKAISDLEAIHMDEKRILGNQILALAQNTHNKTAHREEYDPYGNI